MGAQKTTAGTQQTTTYTPTAAEQQMQNLQLGQYQQTVGPQTQLQLQGMDLISKLLAGEPLPGDLSQLSQGISPQAISAQAAELARYQMPQYNQLGIGDSGVAYSDLTSRIANQLLFPSEQFNIGTRLNLLNLGVGGQAQVQQPMVIQQGQLSQALAGLRSVSQTGTQWIKNPFLTGADIMGGVGTGIGAYGALSSGAGAGAGAGAAAAAGCWVAKEIFGSWEHPKTIIARYYINNIAPDWFRNFYMKYGEEIAQFIHNKPIFKLILRPLFEYFALRGRQVGVSYAY